MGSRLESSDLAPALQLQHNTFLLGSLLLGFLLPRSLLLGFLLPLRQRLGLARLVAHLIAGLAPCQRLGPRRQRLGATG